MGPGLPEAWLGGERYVALQLATYATSAEWTADLTPKLPRRKGNDACCHEVVSGMVLWITQPREERRASSSLCSWLRMLSLGTVLRRWFILQMPRQLLKRCISACGSSNSNILSCTSITLSIIASTCEDIKSADPHNGEPRRDIPSLGRHTSGEKLGKVGSLMARKSHIWMDWALGHKDGH